MSDQIEALKKVKIHLEVEGVQEAVSPPRKSKEDEKKPSQKSKTQMLLERKLHESFLSGV